MMIKRIFDVLAASVLLSTFLPVLLLVAVGVAVTMGRPVLFRQVRPGLHSQLFTLYKFRSMKDLRGADGEPLPDEERRTPFGILIRKTSLDELPELFNVIKGDMSLVGPRPLLTEYLDRYTPEQSRRHEVRPGITGLAQVSGRNEIPFSKRIELDVWYVDHRNLWLDLKILLSTIPCVIGFRGVAEGRRITNLHVDDLGMVPDYILGDRGQPEKDTDV